MELVIKATHFAAEKHRTQRRKNRDKDPYINHPIQVAALLTEAVVKDPVIICAGLLHDVIEDTDATYEEVKANFGEDVANMVMEVTDDKSLPKVERKKLQIEHAKHISKGAKLIKLCDKYSNLCEIKDNPPEHWSEEIRRGYIVWCYAVCKNLFGINSVLDSKLVKLFDSLNVFCIYSPYLLELELEIYYSFLKPDVEKEKLDKLFQRALLLTYN